MFRHWVNKVLAFFRREKKKKGVKIMSETKETKTNIDTSLETNKNRLVTEKVAASIIGVSYETLKRSIRWQQRIPYYKMNKRISYRISDLEEFIQKCKIPAKN
jgi:D-ribose pyranose/furanose isomerase RbsD